MVRIDHVMGLWRQFWVPDNMSAREGAYVSYPSRELLAIVALESARAGALVVGEDLGTVPDEVRPEMAARGMLSSTVFWFERSADGGFVWPSAHKAQSLASMNTHDLPTMAGWWLGRDLTSDAAVEQRTRDRENLLHMVNEYLSDTPAESASDAPFSPEESAALLVLTTHEVLLESDRDLLGRFVAAVHQLLCTSGATLVSLSLDDLVLETEQVNRPGVSLAEYRSWSRKMTAAPWARG
jgi:4-alpha-glucanotransferase